MRRIVNFIVGLLGGPSMLKFLFRRTLAAIPVLFFVTLFTFLLIRAVPGGPFDNFGGKSPPAWLKAALEARYGLNKPMLLNLPNDGIAPDNGMETRTTYTRLPNCDKLAQGLSSQEATDKGDPVVIQTGWYLLHFVEEHNAVTTTLPNGKPAECDRVRTVLYSDLTRAQFPEYLNNVLRLDFGPSLGRTNIGVPVWEIISKKLSVSAQLGLFAVILGFSIGIPLGVIAALSRNTFVDYFITSFSILYASIPSFVLGPLMIFLFVVTLKWLPGPDPRVWTNGNILSWDFLSRALLPFVVLGTGISPFLARLTRGSLLQVLNDDYIRTARAKGLRERAVIYVHALKNALIPIATIVGPLLAGILTGSFFIERIFAIPGLGEQFLLSVQDRNYNLLTGLTLVYSLFLVLGNIMVDVTYTWLDPRIRFD